jgi:hypothetical protein
MLRLSMPNLNDLAMPAPVGCPASPFPHLPRSPCCEGARHPRVGVEKTPIHTKLV